MSFQKKLKNWAQKLKKLELQDSQNQFSKRTQKLAAKTENTGTAKLTKTGFKKT